LQIVSINQKIKKKHCRLQKIKQTQQKTLQTTNLITKNSKIASKQKNDAILEIFIDRKQLTARGFPAKIGIHYLFVLVCIR
jgi:hypothetical protein